MAIQLAITKGAIVGREYSIAEARNHLSQVVRLAEDEGAVELTRRGKPVAVVVSRDEFLRLQTPAGEPFGFLERFRAQHNVDRYGLEPDDLAGLRDPHPGRIVRL
ncbi:MAG: type II toxin-antitoxin system Phd/YefM family antitoxin [Actinobacteria bacterium]|nr:type II toxin-antitoxin system Phd/YefM family antitoxin [Actinomycetota bacterium]